MNSAKRSKIEQRAYALWVAEGQPNGRHEEHWHRAAREIGTELVRDGRFDRAFVQ